MTSASYRPSEPPPCGKAATVPPERQVGALSFYNLRIAGFIITKKKLRFVAKFFRTIDFPTVKWTTDAWETPTIRICAHPWGGSVAPHCARDLRDSNKFRWRNFEPARGLENEIGDKWEILCFQLLGINSWGEGGNQGADAISPSPKVTPCRSLFRLPFSRTWCPQTTWGGRGAWREHSHVAQPAHPRGSALAEPRLRPARQTLAQPGSPVALQSSVCALYVQ